MPVCKAALSGLSAYSKARGINVIMIPKDVGRGLHVARNHTHLANAMIGEWLLIVGSDHNFHQSALCQLLDGAIDKDGKVKRPIISGITPAKQFPWRPMAFRRDETGKSFMPFRMLLDYGETECMTGMIVDKPYGGVGGGMDIVTGSGFCLYHRSVFDAVPYPWFDAGVNMHDLGHYGPDVRICADAHRFGIGSAVHLGVMVEHYEMQAIHVGRHIEYCNQSKWHWMAETHQLNNSGANEKAVQDVVALWDGFEIRRKSIEAEDRKLEAHAESESGGETESVCEPVHEKQGSQAGLPGLEAASSDGLQQVAGTQKEKEVA